MGQIVGRALGVPLLCFTPSGTRAEKLAKETKGEVASSLDECLKSDLVFLGMKPQQFKEVAAQLKNKIEINKTIVSLLAGVGIDELKTGLGHKKMIRLMPNTLMEIGRGICLLHGAKEVELEVLNFIEEKLSLSSKVLKTSNEQVFDQLTLISGCGPGLLYQMALHLQESALNLGLKEESEAQEIIGRLFMGVGERLIKGDLTSEELRDQVTSKGGVTSAILESWAGSQLSQILFKGFEAGKERTELLKKDP